MKDRRRWIETGYGLEGILPDGKVGDIGRQMVPMLRNNDFDGAMTLAVDEISQIIAQDAGVKLQPLTRWGATQQQPHATAGQIIGGIVFLIVVVIFLIWAGGSGLLGFLLGMFFGGGGRLGWWRRVRRFWRRRWRFWRWWWRRERLWRLRRRQFRRRRSRRQLVGDRIWIFEGGEER